MAINHRQLVILMSFLLCVLWGSEYACCSDDRRIKVAFRYDDYSTLSYDGFDEAIVSVFIRHGVPLVIAVIPAVYGYGITNPLPAYKANFLRRAVQSGFVTVAQHGYSHKSNRRTSHGINSEFHGVDYKRQLETIKNGRILLEKLVGTPLTYFVPPWNTYDENTVRALRDLGFTTLMAGERNYSKFLDNVRHFPATCELTEVQKAVYQARKSKAVDIVIIVLFHAYDFHDFGVASQPISSGELNQILNWLKSQEDVLPISIDKYENDLADSSGERFRVYTQIREVQRYLPYSLSQSLMFCPSTAEAQKIYQKSIIVTVIFYMMVSITAIMITIIILRYILAGIRRIVIVCFKYTMFFASLSLVFFVCLHPEVSPRRLLLTITSLSVYIGTLTYNKSLTTRNYRHVRTTKKS
jgi:peptidoglycan/xylan/chitin deacetylase (PgdA/CDA1 family)